MKNVDECINEGTEMSRTYVNGKKVVASWSGSTDNLKEFIKLIEDAPETLDSIKVQTGTSSFNPSSEKISGPLNSSKKKKIIKLIKDADKAFKKDGEKIHTYELKSYYGASSRKHDTDPAYTMYRTKRSDKFGRDMSSGKYGSLD